MKWSEQTLGAICGQEGGLIQTGPFGSQLHQSDYQDEGVPVIMPQDITDGRVNPGSVAKIAEETADRLKRHKLKRDAIVMPRRGDINKRAFITENEEGSLCGTGCIKIELAGSMLEPRFLYYYLEQPQIVSWIEQHAVGTTMLNLNTKIIEGIPIRYPHLDVQRSIAGVLSAYDELMENNRRRMELLEAAARQLYREWFVRLRFPGREHTGFVDGVPEGWEIHLLDDLCCIGRGASPRPINDFMGGEIPWFKIGDATSSESVFVFQTKEHVSDDGAKKSVLLKPGSLILSNSATCGIPYFTGVRGCVHDGWLHFGDFNRVSVLFLYCYLYFKQEELVNSVGDGSTQKNLNTAAVGRLRVALPPNNSLLQQFEDVVAPIFTMVSVLPRQNISLRAARDLLLPKLMSGEIAV